jgi:hypothetical protein
MERRELLRIVENPLEYLDAHFDRSIKSKILISSSPYPLFRELAGKSHFCSQDFDARAAFENVLTRNPSLQELIPTFNLSLCGDYPDGSLIKYRGLVQVIFHLPTFFP